MQGLTGKISGVPEGAQACKAYGADNAGTKNSQKQQRKTLPFVREGMLGKFIQQGQTHNAPTQNMDTTCNFLPIRIFNLNNIGMGSSSVMKSNATFVIPDAMTKA